tara:strand:+ start:174 stop:653 length:480 start_codon:yes stop_codon:yes gene_type:complete
MTKLKLCERCGLEKPLIEFYKKKKDKSGNDLASPCKECTLKRMKSYNKTKRPHKRKLDLQRKYGITIDDYERMLTEQKGVCAICGNGGGNKHLHVDHCHDTNKVRGLLCFNCNNALGNFKDNTDLLNRASMYLQFSRGDLEYYDIDGKKLNNLMEVDNT